MPNYLSKAIAALCLTAAASGVSAAPIDLSSWSALTLDFPGGQEAGNWVLQPGNNDVTQTLNADPSFFLNNLNQTQFEIDGQWQVNTASDDDYMGFVFGYQNSSNFYLFDWKRGSQSYEGQTATEGMTIKKFEGATGNGLVDLSLAEMWENTVNVGDMSILATNHSSSAGWVNGVLYDFYLGFNIGSPGNIEIVVKDGTTELWNVAINDTTFTAGQFGFYNYSQEMVRYAGFEQTGGVIIDPDPQPLPLPGTLMLLGMGIAGLSVWRRRPVKQRVR